MSATDGGEPEAEAERDPFAPEVLRALLPSEVQGKQQRVLVCALRNPDANAVQIAQKTGVASTYTVTNSLRSLLLGIAGGHTGDSEDITELRGGIRDAESYGELTEKQAAVVDFAALHPEYVEGHTYGDVAQAIHETDGTPVSETHVGGTLRKYGTLVQQRRAWATAQGEVDADLDEVAGALTVREFLEAAGFDLPDHDLDRMPEAGPGRQATLAEAQQAEAGEAFQPGHQYEGEGPEREPEPADEPQEAETETEALLLPEELEDRLRDLEQGLDALRDETPRNWQVREFAEKVEARLDEVDAGTSEAHEALRSEVYDALQNSVKRDALDRVDAAEQKVDALQEMVNSLAEQVQAATTLTGLRARAQQDLQRLEAEGADVLAYSFQQKEGRITMNLQAEAQEAEDGE